MRHRKTLLPILLLLVCTSLFPQSPLNYLTSTTGGSCYEICYYSNHIYAGAANTLIVYDLTGPNQTPGTKTFEHRFISNIDNILEKNGYLYVCANHDGIWKFNLSNPASPTAMYHYSPANINESIYDLAFYGDSILVAAKNKVNVLLDSANTFTYKGSIANFSGSTRVHGIDVKDSLLAYTVGFSSSSAQEGLYLYDLKNSTQLDFYNQVTADGWEVNFGQSNKLIHVSGGNIPLTDKGIYYALDYSNPTSLSLKIQDTIMGLLFPLGSLAAPMSAKVINDTIYISTQGAGPIGYTFPNPFYGQIYVYDATDPNNITQLTDLYAGLYHFDADINETTRKMYVASEWYGILTVDVNNIFSESLNAKTLTGGWCHGSSRAKNRLVEASEGYGVRMFDITAIQSPTLLAEDTAVGFCRAISITDSADYVYGWFLTGQRLRVYDANLNLLNSIMVDTGALVSDYSKSRLLGNKVAAIEDVPVLFSTQKKVIVADISSPSSPSIIMTRRNDKLRDLLFHSNSDLITLAEDSIIVFDGSLNQTSSVQPPGGGFQQYKAFTLSNDTLYVYYDGLGEGIAKYLFNPSTHSLTYLSASVYNMAITGTGRVHLASDDDYLYISSTLDQLKALTKSSPHTVVASYDHGADFMFDNLWGVTDLYYKEGYLFLNEYMGQTSIFGPATSAGQIKINSEKIISVYPNPCKSYFTLATESNEEYELNIYDATGKLIYSTTINTAVTTVNTSELKNGIYFLKICSEDKIHHGKIIIQR